MAKLAVFRGVRLAVGASLAAAGAAALCARGGLRVLAADLRPGGRLRERLIIGGDSVDGDDDGGGFFAPASGGMPAVFCAPADPAAAAAGLAEARADADIGFVAADAARADAAVAVVVFTYAEDDLRRAREIAAAAAEGSRVLFVPSWVDAAFPRNADLRARAAAALNADPAELAALELPYAPQAAADLSAALTAPDLAAALTRLTAQITAALGVDAVLPDPAAGEVNEPNAAAPPQTGQDEAQLAAADKADESGAAAAAADGEAESPPAVESAAEAKSEAALALRDRRRAAEAEQTVKQAAADLKEMI